MNQDNNKYDVVILDEGTIDEQVNLFSEVFHTITKDHWINKHYKNPLGKSIIFGVFIDNNLAGMNAFMPMRYKVNNTNLIMMQSCDSCVSLRYRRMGIWGSIIRHAMDYFKSEQNKVDALIGFPNYTNSYPGFLKAGWETVTFMHNYALVTHGDKLIKSLSLPVPSWIGRVANIQSLFLHMLNKSRSGFSVIRETVKDGYIKEKDLLYLDISQDWLKWKMDYSHQKSYIVTKSNEDIAGFIVQTCKKTGGTYSFMSSCVSYTDDDLLFKQAISYFIRYISNDNDSFMIRLSSSNSKKYKGFGLIEILKHRRPFIVYPIKESYNSMLLDAKNWEISALSLD